jgi:TonB family protein
MRRASSWIVALCLSGGVLTPTSAAPAEGPAGRKAIERVAPVYPQLARRTHIRGVVKLDVVVRPNGTVKSAKVLGGSPVLIESATDAVRKWRFEAGPEETTETVQVTFEPD